MKQHMQQTPSREQVRRFIMEICTRERLAELATEKGVKNAARMSKRQLCDALIM